MKKQLLLLATVLLACGSVLGQRTVTGKVTDTDGMALLGASVLVKGTTIGTTTDLDGTYSLEVPADATTLVFSYTGYNQQEVQLGASNTLDITLDEGVDLGEIIITGVATGTSKKKVTFTINQLGTEQLQEVPSTSAAQALQGKIAGVQVVNATGTPGQAPTIKIRGATGLIGSQNPLIIVDGVMIEGSLADINMEDVETIEVVKGAAASALYGSRAANGVVVIKTKRGADGSGRTTVKYRTEYGISQLAREMELADHHSYKLASDWQSESRYTRFDGETYNADGLLIDGARSLDDDHYADNPYAVLNNHFDNFYKDGNFSTHYLSVGSSTDKTNFLLSYQYQDQEGIIQGSKGFQRNNIRFNLDHQLTDKILLSTSNLISLAKEDRIGGGGNFGNSTGGPFYDLLFMAPDVNLNGTNEEDGTPFNIDADPYSNEDNPLYQLANVSNKLERNGVLSSTKITYDMFNWLSLDAQYSYERRNRIREEIQKKGYLQRGDSPGQATADDGSLELDKLEGLAQTFQATALIVKDFNDFHLRSRLSYLYEDNELKFSEIDGNDLAFVGVTSLENAVKITGRSEIRRIKAENLIGIVDFDYRDKYIASALFRRDGASQFGADERYHNYFRVSGAYRISEDLQIPGIDEFKIRAAYGTAGLRPGFAAQYEVYQLAPEGTAAAFLKGNRNLKPSLSKELEIGINLDFLERFSLELVHANNKVEDAFWPASLSSALEGFPNQWRNTGDLETNSYEASLGVNLVSSKNVDWSANFIFSRERTKITKLTIPPTQTGPASAFFFREGETFGIIYGRKWVTSMSEMSGQIPEGKSLSDYKLNVDGYVIESATEGTINERAIHLDQDQDGIPDLAVIGDINSDFNFSFGTNFRWKNLSAYMLWDWKQGGDIYWQTGQWIYREDRAKDFDQAGKPDNQKKARDYYAGLYDVNNTNSHFVRDGTYVKLRELSLYYNLKSNQLGSLGGVFQGIKFGLVGRNILTFTDFPGFDPEVGELDQGINFGFDGFGYPNFRTITGSIQVTF